MQTRIKLLLIVLVAVFAGLWGRLVVIQVFEYQYYRQLAEENRVKVIPLEARRGVIYDRNGEPLVNNGLEGRDYVLGKAGSQVIGYVAEISQEELDWCQEQAERQGRECQLRLGDMLGKMGIEKQEDQLLRGKAGGILVETDADGEIKREIGRAEPISGEDVVLTLDLGLQQQVYQIMEEKPGAVVVTKPQTGEVLALVSSPGFDPDELEKALTDEALPMFNRAIGGEYPPGSVFKIVTATAGLEEGKIDEETLIEDTGEIKVGIYRYGNWFYDQYGQKEGELSLVKAMARSNDIFFYKTGEWLGINKLADWAKYFGVGRQTGIDLVGEAYGLMPDPDWKQEFVGEAWFLGDTYISAIGQGNILMTPLQVHQLTTVIASGGSWCRPHLLIKAGIQDQEFECERLEIADNTLQLIKVGMKQVNEEGGTAWPMADFKVKGERVETAGKTGTAEFGDPEEKTHAWYSVMAPLDEPEVVITVLLEAGGEGSDEAAPIAKEILKFWLER